MRIEGWEGRLAAHISGARGIEFAWGQHDCVMWCARWIEICRGDNFYRDRLGQYHDEASALAFMHANGFTDYAAIASAHLTEVPVPLAQRGDIVQRENGALGICNGLKSHFIAPQGVLTENTLACIRAWKV
ncbi:MAG: hypothetical protein JWN34_357 [Bryobacterales bacterium]|nr:hypothetical protein [Bryobacterales bacterium]